MDRRGQDGYDDALVNDADIDTGDDNDIVLGTDDDDEPRWLTAGGVFHALPAVRGGGGLGCPDYPD